jgi:tetratricopeptide (TPR) repeat protein
LPIAFPAQASDKAKFHLASSAHYSLLSDADDQKNREALIRFEQMRVLFGQLLSRSRVNLSHPIELVGVRSDAEYQRLVPAADAAQSAFFLRGSDRDIVVLNLANLDNCRPAQRPYARALLEYNYPPVQGWFDQGFAAYFAALRIADRQVAIGADPGGLAAILAASPWMKPAEFFSSRPAPPYPGNAPPDLFDAQSWIVIHYLLDKDLLPQTGAYFDLVENQKLPFDQAIQKAYGMTADQLLQAVKEYFQSIASSLNAPAPAQPGSPSGTPVNTIAAPIAASDVGVSTQDQPEYVGRSRLAEVMARVPEHQGLGLNDLENVAAESNTDNAVAHRALAWSYLEKSQWKQANEELETASVLDPQDPWVHYYLALVKFRASEATGNPIQGLPNMMMDLRTVIDWDASFAEAYRMLAVARLQGGGNASAMDAIREALRLNPRSDAYRLDLAEILIASKKWQPATDLLTALKTSADARVAGRATQWLEDLPTLKKYGILPQRSASSPAAPPAPPKVEDDSIQRDTPPEPAPDRRPTQSVKGKLLTVDCSQPPAAVLKVNAGKRILKLRAENYKSLLLIGVDDFSCDWSDRPVIVNYKAGGRADGDLVSLELE